MTKKVYVVFMNHEDKYSNQYESSYDYWHEFRSVVGTEKNARGIMEELALLDYYERYDDAESEMEELWSWDDEKHDVLRFDILEDNYNKMVINSDGSINTYYYEEFEVTF